GNASCNEMQQQKSCIQQQVRQKCTILRKKWKKLKILQVLQKIKLLITHAAWLDQAFAHCPIFLTADPRGGLVKQKRILSTFK
ncbi:MAG: hypothetical protein ACTS7I_03000, partial [Candidatus Hodgkinia cicadicola]